jgi:ATP-binding cassette, subfamily B, multidrug efflux pump
MMSKNGNNQKKDSQTQQGMMGRGRGPRGMGNIEKAKDMKGTTLRLLNYFKEHRIKIAFVMLATIASSLVGLAGPYLLGIAIDKYIVLGDLQGLLRISLMLTGVYIFTTLVAGVNSVVMASVSQGSLMKMRKHLFEHMQLLSLSFFDKKQTGDLMSRLTNDIDAIGALLTQNVTQLVQNLLTLIGIIVLMFSLNVWLALASLIVFPVMVILTAVIGKRTRVYYRDLQKQTGGLNGVIQETLGGQKVVIAFEQQDAVNQKFDEMNKAVKETGVLALTYAMMVPPIMGILSNANIAIVAGLGGWMTLQGLATIGTIATFIQYSRQFANPLRHFANMYNSIQSALAGAERIFEIIDTPPELTDAEDALNLREIKGQVVFEDVDFGYVPGVPVLKKISLHAKPGETIALVGPTGAGKTTMVNVLTRFYDIQNGKITIDGLDIRNVKKDDLRRKLGIVLQDVYLFSGTVMDNIRYGNLEATDEECIAAAKLANADGFIRRLPKGYQTELSERAGNLSQGQRQLLSIARAIIANPAILILDEATSSVDTRTEIQIQQALLNLMEGRTSFVIAHRLSTIRNADMVLVIRDGEIIERGTHKELLDSKGFYYNLYMSQFKGTIDDADFEYIKPVEVFEPIQSKIDTSRRGMGSGMGEGPLPEMMRQRLKEMVTVFKKKDATSPETAKTPEELGLPPMFKMMMQRATPMSQLGAFVEKEGKYYLVEEKL